MNHATAEILAKLTSDFYQANAHTFSRTRQQGWPGWRRCLEVMRAEEPSFGKEGLSVLDCACGNLRFKRFLEEDGLCEVQKYYGVDNCTDLIATAPKQPLLQSYTSGTDLFNNSRMSSYGASTAVPGTRDNTTAADELNLQVLDIIQVLLAGRPLAPAFSAPACDLVVSFGFMHHIPDRKNRIHFIRALVDKTRPGGFCILSFWRFMEDERLAAKARAITAQATSRLRLGVLDEGDYFLDWQKDFHALRYCHSFTDAEIDELVGVCEEDAVPVARFSADGRSDALNTYVVMRRQ